ncbi:hypothetical protein, partial [Ottowia sp.]|uniref:hypothetical protein n=1 Tax=Ottowia sp. TaxID=1898956 RepID=UPI0039E37D4B
GVGDGAGDGLGAGGAGVAGEGAGTGAAGGAGVGDGVGSGAGEGEGDAGVGAGLGVAVSPSLAGESAGASLPPPQATTAEHSRLSNAIRAAREDVSVGWNMALGWARTFFGHCTVTTPPRHRQAGHPRMPPIHNYCTHLKTV